ncbi:DUF5689 domain-containing protein [Empedobacter falsenii]|uniref:DUF5689 domain-containing protein n=1 Tax=Empedobacter falsenii TaxID=343874 RepID=A0A7H9DXF8_9FLAO|nr:DUF5689 domain-containing protein [Empedobacter falsenii]QLL59419.1 hypothetical protein FH779_15595 [Empedobacter falsenii]
MNTISKLTIASLLSLGLFITQSCVQDDDYATPPIDCADKLTANITIADLTTKVTSGQIKLDSNGAIAEDLVMDAYVISSDETGNFYKTISLQDKIEDPTTGIQIEIDGANLYANYPLGARIQISLKGLVVAKDRGIMKIGSVDPTYAVGRIPSANMKKYIFKTCDPIKTITPKVYNSLSDALKAGNLNTLVTIKNVQFQSPDTDKTYGVEATTVNRVLVDKTGKTVDLRNSGYAKWYNEELPKGSGEITVVVSIYNSTYQVYIRDTKDVKFDQPRFDVGGGQNPGGGNNTEATNLLFKGSDFNVWADFLSSINSFGLVKDTYATSGVGVGRDNTNALLLKGTPKANDYVFTTIVNNTIPATPKKITFYVKGTSGKSLSLNVYKSDKKYVVYNVGDLSNANVSLSPIDANQYTGKIDTKGEWVLVTLNIEGVDIQKTAGENIFALKVGKDEAYDLVIDNIKID